MSTNGFHALRTAWPDESFLSLLDRSLHGDLWGIGRVVDHRAGDVIAEQGTAPDSVTVVVSGFAKTVRAARKPSRPMMLAVSGPGELLDVEAHWTNTARHAGHVRSTDGKAFVVDRARFGKFAAIPAVKNALLDVVVRRSVLRDASLSFATHNVRTRLLAFLARMEFLHGRRTPLGVQVDIGLNCCDISAAIGASTPAVTKALKELKLEGVLTVHPKRVVILENLKGVLDRSCEADAKVAQDEGQG
jgi:CRP-like cAMP-binding protein